MPHGDGVSGCESLKSSPKNSMILTDFVLPRNLPIGALVLFLLYFFLKIKRAENENRSLPVKKKMGNMDPLGCLVFIGAICCLLLALQWGGQTKPWSSSTVVGLLVGSIVLASVFGYLQWRRQERALIPLRVLRKRSIYTGAMVLFFLGASTYLVAPSLHKLFELMVNILSRTSSSSHSISRPYEASVR